MNAAPYYVLFAGVNGAGKSTLFHTGMWRRDTTPHNLARINSDEILVENKGNPASEADQLKAGRQAVQLVRTYLQERQSFNQETTLTGVSIMRNIAQAKDAGFHVCMFYVGIAKPSIAMKRIEHRVELGGHGIGQETVHRRYNASLDNLCKAVDICDEVYLYDNTIALELEACFQRGRLDYFNPSEPHLAWIKYVMEACGYHDIDLP